MGRILSNEQQAAVDHFMGPCLCIAGPGSGKTLVITERIASLVKKGVEPGRILVVTFTRDAASSMKRRCEGEHKIYPSPAFGTFHSVFYNILLKEGKIRPERLISGRKAIGLLSLSVNECGRKEVNSEFYSALLRTISYYKNTGFLDENLYPNDTTTDEVKSIIASFAKNTTDAGYFDFDDILVETRRFFSSHPERLDFWRKRFPFILVDEAQDMNKLQYDIITELSHPLDNLFLVGDDDQAIYGFRGSDPSFLLKFRQDFPKAESIILNKNYRSDSIIVESSAKLISENRERFKKNLSAFSKDRGNIELITSKDEREEGRLVAQKIKELLDRGEDPSEIAVLYRSRMVSACLLEEMERLSSPGTCDDIFFYKSFVFIDILSYLEISQKDVVKREDFVTALTHPDKNIGVIGLGRKEVDKREWLDKMKKTVFAKDAVLFIGDISFISRLSPSAAINYILKKMGYGKFIRDFSYKNGQDASIYNRHAEILQKEAMRFRHIGDFCEAMHEKKERALFSETKSDRKSKIGCYTFHGSKGLEFNTVFIIGACDGITPSDKADTAAKIEEERRIFYVAMTRAKKSLYISVCGKYGNHIYYPSPFLKEAFGSL
ncbi:MAG: ATP-dependent helicase [Lachnospiraceae bacterium]|uniref:DNA 3'-5' helicase n=1 Tax=Candidatus Weimeria bifida TaxID=2599074 RepID=A0A6N7J0S0_9FIRM|nr:ATP-dependent helicase [Candidatus Weimeria bifida]RRF96350.1 MAG: ATP-dependent helicase [Lachnospiraceae bacterium]